ncbi:glycosyltransferase [Halosegnis rubeus]|uniref:Glycosyltransferase n=1 Tax=Halosegnis rubeus TaxID=2212850 RepID=A0A5N5UP31_9EURY|nr:glycosyltransferase [Halosegnis rubeus]KAB7519446.1 glycosyltransferase [Halosegnis rubeus]
MTDARFTVIVESPSRLTYLISSMETGGAQWGMIRLLGNLSPTDYDVTVVALQSVENNLVAELPEHVSFVDLAVTPRYRFDRLVALIPIIKGSDILVCSLYHATITGRIFGSVWAVPTVLNWKHNGRFRGGLRRLIYLLTNSLSDGVLADSAYVARVMGEQPGNLPIFEVPIAGINIDRFPIVQHSETDQIVVGTLGTLRWEKQHEQVLAVAEALPKIEFVIGGDGERYEELQNMIENRRLENVKLAGHIDDVASFLAGLDIYFQPSLSEGLCITVLEAMAAGLPVVASDVGGISDSVLNGVTGYLRSPEETMEFKQDIRYLSKDPEIRREFGREARSRVEEIYSEENLVTAFREALLEVSEGGPC